MARTGSLFGSTEVGLLNGLGTKLGGDARPACGNPWVRSPTPQKPAVAEHTCHSSNLSSSQTLCEFSLGYMRPCLGKKITKKKPGVMGLSRTLGQERESLQIQGQPGGLHSNWPSGATQRDPVSKLKEKGPSKWFSRYMPPHLA